MAKYILGKKIGMTTLFGEKGEALNVTLVECGSKVSLVRNLEKDGYEAVQMEIDKTKNKKFRREARMEKSELKVGDAITVENFAIGDIVRVTGLAKAKGFQGVVKRHGFAGSPSSHGRKHDMRKPGSIGAGYPEHVIKGKRMAGRMGGKKVSSKNVKVVFIDKEKNLLGLKGPVPGVSGRVVEIFAK